jgi:hypothetical protein
MQPPYVDDKVPVFKVPMEDGVLGKANNDKSSNSGFSIHINQNVNNTSALKSVVEHESHHIDQMVRGDLAYDDNNVYWKGKKYSREKMDEGNHDLPWEKEVYNKTKQKKMAFKLRDGAGKQSPFNNLTKRGLTPLKQVEGEEPKSSVPEEYGDFEVVAEGPEKRNVKRKKAPSSGRFANKLAEAGNIGDASKALDILSTAKASTKGEKAALSKAMKKYKGQGGIATQY